MGDDSCHGRKAMFFDSGFAGQNEGTGTIGNRARIGRGNRAVFCKGSAQLRDLIDSTLVGLLIIFDDDRVATGFDGDRRCFCSKQAIFDGVFRS